ncbi:MAG: class I SAM-dependent methyltransferase [Verrucomicrobiaceae bacterium]|nr:class I SAM-dependent methyltransferase [Verrucomicrobiaceae bacterium]
MKATIGEDVESYYKLHAQIYDATRWTFLFGRNCLVEQLSRRLNAQNILEVGCGTGQNLVALARAFPTAKLTGLDLSSEMLAFAERNNHSHRDRLSLVQGRYERPIDGPYDLVLFSYALSMFNPGWEMAIDAAQEQVAGGYVAVVDFHDTPVPLFRSWMAMNHVQMDCHLLPRLEKKFERVDGRVRAAWVGLWRYFTFIGKAK